MKPSDRVSAVHELVDLTRAPSTESADLAAILQGSHAQAVAQLHEWSAGFPSGGSTAPPPPREAAVCPECAARSADGEQHVDGCTEADGIRIDYSDRTGDLACRPDPYQRDIDLFDRRIERARKALRDARRSEDEARDALRDAHRIVLTATAPNSQADTAPAPCLSCQRDKDHKERPFYEPAHRAGLCQFCGRWQSGHGAWPPVKILEAHHRGERITSRLVERLTKAG